MANNKSRKNTTDHKLALLANAFAEKRALTTKEIGDLLNTSSRTTVISYIKSLQASGIAIVSQKKGAGAITLPT